MIAPAAAKAEDKENITNNSNNLGQKQQKLQLQDNHSYRQKDTTPEAAEAKEAAVKAAATATKISKAKR